MNNFRAVGIDVSAREVHVAAEGRDDIARFENTPVGFKRLLHYVTKARVREVRVVLEATGTYHLDLACALDDHPKCRVMVVNPRIARNFHDIGKRAKTDRVDAASLLSFAQRMDFQPWTRPSKPALEARATARYVDQLVKDQTRLKNQLHAAQATKTTPDWVRAELQQRLEATAQWVTLAKRKLVELIRAMPDTAQTLDVLQTVLGIGTDTAAQLVAEYAFLDPEMTGKQLTAWAGLDPLPQESGTSVKGRRGMSKRGNARVRQMLFMSALAASRQGPFADLKARVAARSGQKKVGLGAVMRKLLIVTWAMFRTRMPWDPELAAPREKSARAA